MDHTVARLCPRFHYAIELIGRRWTGALLMLLVQRESSRYNELLAAVPGISDRLLSERLRELEREGLIDRIVDPGPPVRVSYRLTPAGRDLQPTILALAQWADHWIPGDRANLKAADVQMRSSATNSAIVVSTFDGPRCVAATSENLELIEPMLQTD